VVVDARAGHAFVANAGDIQWSQNGDGTNSSYSYRAISPTVSVLDTRTGATVRTLTLGGQVPYAMVVDSVTSRLFVATGPMPPTAPGDGGTMRVLDTRTGAVVRSIPLQRIPPLAASAMAVDETAGRVFVALGDVTNSTGASTLWVFDAGTGAVLRTGAAGRGDAVLMVATRAHRLFVSGSMDETVRVLDTRTGAIVRSLKVGRGPAAMAVDEHRGRLFVVNGGTYEQGHVTGNGTVRMFDAQSGAILGTVGVGLATAIAVDGTAGRAFVHNGMGHVDKSGTVSQTDTISVLDTGSGALLRTVPLGQAPGLGPIAVDEHAGRAFVIKMFTTSVSVLKTQSGALLRTVVVLPATGRRGA
jgi:DNA-binding beta-propeller fold protein YncE